jgi:sulfate adenylyltransferase subunit 2
MSLSNSMQPKSEPLVERPASLATSYRRTHLAQLESEAVYVIREVAAHFERPVLLFSGGKDSVVLAHLARKAFHPAASPFPLLHVDTGHNFAETLRFRDAFARDTGSALIVRCVQDSIERGSCQDEPGPNPSRNALQSVTLIEALAELGADAALGGGRREEEKARAKERFFSHRDRSGQWDPRNQRPELWGLVNAKRSTGEHFRVFPLANWTELDVWEYVHRESLVLPELYFASERHVVRRNGVLLALGVHNQLLPGEKAERLWVRCRTVGDTTCTGMWESHATTVEQVVAEVASARVSERGGRADDRRSEASMEDRKRQGYF